MKRKDGIESFMAGFQSVREKEIDRSLSYREISDLRPDVESGSVANLTKRAGPGPSRPPANFSARGSKMEVFEAIKRMGGVREIDVSGMAYNVAELDYNFHVKNFQVLFPQINSHPSIAAEFLWSYSKAVALKKEYGL